MPADNMNPKKALLGPLKGLTSLEKMKYFFNYSLQFNGVIHAYGLPVLGAATHGWLRWGVRLALEKKL